VEEIQAVAAETTATTSANPPAETTTLKFHLKRHWRPSRLALEFAPGEAVSVTRRLYRSGESEYLLNNRICRLRDIQDLFSGTGLSGAHYAIIEQGRIGQILSAKPMDRRTLIEEAAGITKFRVRQRAAEARLEAARSNLSRVSDIISEIERQVGSLRRQAAKARRYRQVREELRELLRRVYAADERALNSRPEAVRARLSSVTSGSESLVLKDVQMREASDASARQLEEAEAAHARRSTEVLEAESAIERARGELLTHTAAAERLSEIGRQLETVL